MFGVFWIGGGGRGGVHGFVGHPVCFVGPAGGDAAVAGVQTVFVFAGTVGDDVRWVGSRWSCITLGTGRERKE